MTHTTITTATELKTIITNAISAARPKDKSREKTMSELILERIEQTKEIQSTLPSVAAKAMDKAIAELQKQYLAEVEKEESNKPKDVLTDLQVRCLRDASKCLQQAISRLEEVYGDAICTVDWWEVENPNCARVKNGYTRDAWRELRKNDPAKYKELNTTGDEE